MKHLMINPPMNIIFQKTRYPFIVSITCRRHLFGCYHIFTNCLTPISEKDKVVFIDFGCGPLTSGIAFRAFVGQCDITYLGIDSSQTMLNKAEAINTYGPNTYREPFFDKIALIRGFDSLHRLLDRYIEKGDRAQIIFNFCYFFSSPTLNIDGLSDVLFQIMTAYNQHKLCLIYQNPDHRSLSGARRLKLYGKWEELKTITFRCLEIKKSPIRMLKLFLIVDS